ncbi:hypothetical protein [Geodermatophilus sp. SYSU D00079]
MAYRSRAAAVMSAADRAVELAAEKRVPAWIGVNLVDPGNDSPSTVLAHDGGDPAVELAALEKLVAMHSATVGLAIHDARHLGMVA